MSSRATAGPSRQPAPSAAAGRRAPPRAPRAGEEGGALVFVLIVMVAVLFVAAMSINIGLSGRKISVNNLRGKEAFVCAETALERARNLVATHQEDATGKVLAGQAVDWYPISGSCPGSTDYTYTVVIEDNLDDADQTTDVDKVLLLHARTYFGLAGSGTIVAAVSGMVDLSQTILMHDYSHQSGEGSRKSGNKTTTN